MPTLQEFFADSPTSRSLFDHLVALLDSLDPFDMRITTSQIAFRRRIAFAWAWLPAKYLRGRGAPLVLSIALRRRDPSPRWKQVVEPAPGRFMHHLELHQPGGLDAQVQAWLQEAWQLAG